MTDCFAVRFLDMCKRRWDETRLIGSKETYMV